MKWFLAAWFGIAVPPFSWVEVSVMPPSCNNLQRGCYIPVEGRAYIRARMPAWERECVIAHEYLHYLGLDHGENETDC